VISGSSTRGLRPYGSPEIVVQDASSYLAAMAGQNIFLNRDERRETIQGQIAGLAEKVDGTIPDDAGLLDEVTNLVEAPMALLGKFEDKYLELPREVLITVMKKHQRYFALQDYKGNLLPYFIAVRNGDDQHLDIVAKGNEHVIRARFSDASYFIANDVKKPLEKYLPRLDTLTFHEKLGSMLAKNNRVMNLAGDLAPMLNVSAENLKIAKEAASIAKADLATQMVVEMTSLQGVMGREYAKREGRSEAVANAIFEHWLPRSAGDILPQSEAGTLLAITDRLDSLVGLFAAGLAPKSSSDPFGLRRAALGIVQILIAKGLDLDLDKAIDVVSKAQVTQLDNTTRHQLLEFIKGRLDGWLEEEIGAPRDVINAVLAEQAYNPFRAYQGIKELLEWVKRENWEYILDNFARCVRISRGEKMQYNVSPANFADEQEKALYAAYEQVAKQLNGAGNVDAFLKAFEPIVPTIFAFFEKVMVNDPDEKLRQNRLALMQAITNLQKGRADLSELVGF
jgi:glycyl-tRNA synthetase